MQSRKLHKPSFAVTRNSLRGPSGLLSATRSAFWQQPGQMADNGAGRGQLVHARQRVFACRVEQNNFIVVSAHRILGQIGHQQRHFLALAFGLGVGNQVVALPPKATT